MAMGPEGAPLVQWQPPQDTRLQAFLRGQAVTLGTWWPPGLRAASQRVILWDRSWVP